MPFAEEIVRSLHDPRLYREAAARSKARSLWQVARLALLAALAVTIGATFWLSSLWSEHVRPVLDALPTITIRDGVATVDGPQPWVRRIVRDHRGHDWVLILDTTERATDFAPAERGLLLARTEIRIKGSGVRVDTVPLSRFGDVRLGPKALRRALLRRLMLVPPAMLVVLLAWFLVAKLAQALLLAWWMKRLGTRRAAPLTLRARLGVASHALTAPVLFDCLRWWVAVPAILAWPIYFALAAVYAAAGERQLPDGA